MLSCLFESIPLQYEGIRHHLASAVTFLEQPKSIIDPLARRLVAKITVLPGSRCRPLPMALREHEAELEITARDRCSHHDRA